MRLKSILNRVQLHHGFVYGSIRLLELKKRPALEVEIRPRKNSRPVCSVCGGPGPGYDTLPTRRFEFVPLWEIAVFFLYDMRRVNCPRCGVKVEHVPWAEGKNHLTITYAWFLAKWDKRLSWKESADAFETSWDNVFRAVKMAVAWGLGHCPPQPRQCHSDRHRRDLLEEERLQVLDTGLPDRRRMQETALDRQRPHQEDPAELLR